MVPFLVTGSVQLHAWSIYLVRAGTQVLPEIFWAKSSWLSLVRYLVELLRAASMILM